MKVSKPMATDQQIPERTSAVLYEVSGGIATLTLNRPEKLNAWTWQMTAEVRDAMRRACDDSGVRVVVLTGAGDAFCAGADMTLLSGLKLSPGSGSSAPRLPPFEPGGPVDFYGTNSYFPSIRKPVIGAINGVAAGLGFVYALFCDVRIASDNAYFIASFAKRGAVAEHGISWLLPRVVGLGNALDILLSSRKINAREALRMGLVNRVVPRRNLMEVVLEYARVLAQESSPRSLSVIKRQVWAAQASSLSDDVLMSQAEIALSIESEDFKEGIAHFMERRGPRFTGR